jgi:carbamoyltransferase
MGPRGDVVLGLSFDFHDAAAALLVGGELVAAAEQERFSRRKHDDALPADAIAACLEVAGIRADEIGSVVFYEKPVSVADRYLAAKRQAGLGSLGSFVRDAPTVFGRNLAAGARVALALRRLGAPNPPRVEYLEHHLSHAAAAYYPSPFDDAAILTIDGIGEWATTTVGWGRGRRIDLLEELRYPDSLGLVYSFVTAFCGFRPNEDEYKVMGLAPYGVPRFAEALSSFVPRSADGSFQVRADRLGWFQHAAMEGCDLVEALDGPPRAPGAPLTQREADIAASLQQLTEMTVLHLVERARELVPA